MNKKFEAIQRKNQAIIQKHIDNYESSSDEEDDGKYAESIIRDYLNRVGRGEDVQRTQTYLEENSTSCCLICLLAVKSTQMIWDCNACYCIFHLQCIQKWGKDRLTRSKEEHETRYGTASKQDYFWNCPKCRKIYTLNELPRDYKCFCRGTVNPKSTSWLYPHTCGEKCRKPLRPQCGHECLMLCHPGPCPPCAQTVNSRCFCGKKQRVQRCLDKFWNCGMKCERVLRCGEHKCLDSCHADECKPCAKIVARECACGSLVKKMRCGDGEWHCEKKCNKILQCQQHNCQVTCHAGTCTECQFSGIRSCPCGKKQFDLPCTEDIPCCEDTCEKLMECQVHVCLRKCHRDKCGTCLQMVVKQCRCGAHTKELPCQKEYTCDIKCKKIRDCTKHACNRKCCDGACPPCEKPCGKTLPCGSHKCQSTCHVGSCFPCHVQITIKCHCGATSIQVPCGRRKTVKPPVCRKPCTNPPDCHHTKRDAHECHFGECPPCKQICQIPHKTCDHACPNICHTSVLIVAQRHASMPWEQGVERKRVKQKCAECVVPVSITCPGKHKSVQVECYKSRNGFDCGRVCGRLLKCANHRCGRKCHVVEGAIDDVQAGQNCETCTKTCEKKPPLDCTHKCVLNCHPGTCPECLQITRMKCHCGISQIFVRCNEYSNYGKREQLLSCGNQCPKLYTCGHRCQAKCHSNSCPVVETCTKRVKLTCPCKRIKKDTPCHASKWKIIECDDNCASKRERIKHEQDVQQLLREQEAARRNLRELEEFEKKFGKRRGGKHKKRLDAVESERRMVDVLRDNYVWIGVFVALIVGVGGFCLFK